MKNRKTIDPMVPWDGDHPYRVMSAFGVTPDSNAQEVLDASYDLPDDSPEVNRAWESLRQARKRLQADFFLYDLPPEPAPAPRSDRGEPPPLPWEFLHGLARSVDDFPEALQGEASPVRPQLPDELPVDGDDGRERR
ncbi:hypothetical protein ACFL3S_04720 [Gemmatimonadota bacterium]